MHFYRPHRRFRPTRAIALAAALSFSLVMCDSGGPTQGQADLTITTPAPRSKLLAGESCTLRWNKSLDRVSIAYLDSIAFYSPDSDGWLPLETESISPTEATITTPELFYDSIAIRIYDSTSEESFVAGYALRYFIFTAAPETGATVHVGDTLHFAWRIAPSLSRATLALDFDNGRQTGYITDGAVDYPDTTYDWIIGVGDVDIAYPAMNARAWIAAYDNEDLFDQMDGTFDILP
jgi:hypothetical protein